MPRAILTLSGLQLASACPSAPVLPRVGSTSPKAEIGSALHEVNAARGEGRSVDLDAVADRWNLEGKDRAVFFARARTLDLGIPEGAVFEVPLCLLSDGSVVPAVGGTGQYEVPDGALVAGTLDILFATPEPLADGRWCEPDGMLWAVDLKTGSDAHVAPIARNWQARVSALLGARWTRAEHVVPGIVYPGPDGGTWDVPMRHGKALPLFPEDLAQIERDVRALAERVGEQADHVARGRLPKLVTGAHCTYCPARVACPAHVAEARALIGSGVDLAPAPLTAEQAVILAGRIGPARKVLEAAEEALKTHVRALGPISLPSGQVFGPVAREGWEFHVGPLRAAIIAELSPLVGQEQAEEFADEGLRATKDGVYDAIRAAHDLTGIKRQMKAAFERIASRHTRADAIDGSEVVTVFEDGGEVRVERGGQTETMTPEEVEARWPVVLSRAADRVPAERWTAHYPKDDETTQGNRERARGG